MCIRDSSLSFASSLAHVCMVDEESRWGLLPALLARAARLGIGGETLNELVDKMVERWREWGAKLQVRTRDIPPFAEILAASPPLRRMGTAADTENRRAPSPCLLVQLIGIPLPELPALMQQIENPGHQPVLIDDTAEGLAQALRRPAQIVIADMSMPGMKSADFCRGLRQTPTGKECYALLLATPEDESRILEAIDAGADDVLVKPLNAQTLRAVSYTHLDVYKRQH